MKEALAAAVALGFLTLSPPHSTGQMPVLDKLCLGQQRATPDERIRACMIIIESTDVPLARARAFNNRASAYSAKGDFERAIQDYDEAIRLNPKDASFFNNRGLVYKAKGDLGRSLQSYDEAIRLNPQYAIALDNRANAYLARGDVERAIQDYDEAIRVNPQDAGFFNNRCLARARADKLEALFLRIHADGAADHRVAGTSTLFPATHVGWTDDIDGRSLKAAKAIQPNIEEKFRSYGIR